MKKNMLLTLINVFCAIFTFAQNVTVGPSAKPLRITPSETLEKFIYYDTDKSPSTLTTISGKTLSVKTLKYNLQTQQLEYTDGDNTYAIQDSIKSFQLKDKTGIEHIFLKKADGKTSIFVETLVTGKHSLLKQHSAKTSVSEDWYTKKQVKKIVTQSNYFTLTNDKLQQFQPSKKALVAAFPDKKTKIQTLIDQENLDPSIETDLIAIFTSLNK
ncbi:hypothetical protein ACJVDH_19140 [Pedobacter sp. AW1-32]|uniref:hypothetical protein n=1 Tax=Pedobacter sp. AW1-32 TaxID=3383026 RepID=UPI003FEED1BC